MSPLIFAELTEAVATNAGDQTETLTFFFGVTPEQNARNLRIMARNSTAPRGRISGAVVKEDGSFGIQILEGKQEYKNQFIMGEYLSSIQGLGFVEVVIIFEQIWIGDLLFAKIAYEVDDI